MSASPDWDRLYQRAASQEGHFTAAQAREAGFSPPLLTYHVNHGRFQRVRRGIYRLSYFPSQEHEQLVVVWLWSEKLGVFSHDTALALHRLSDLLPSKLHLTLPTAWQRRRIRVPQEVVPHYGTVPDSERTWHGSVPVTTPARTVEECARSGVAPELILQAVESGRSRGLFERSMIPNALRYLGRHYPRLRVQ